MDIEKQSTPHSFSDFQIIFEKLEIVKSQNRELFQVIENEGFSLNESIVEIKKIVDAYNTPTLITTFTKA